MADYEQSVFISYAWGTEREDIVNEIDETLQQRGIRIVRDKRALGYRGSIKDFMERIGRGSCVIVVISDKYLRSPNCMFELVEIADNKQFYDRVFPIILSDANIYDPLKRIEYIRFWEAKRKELAKAMKTLDPANLQGIREEMDQYDRIRDKISGITSILKDMNTLTPDMHRDSEFSNLYDAIVERLKENSTDVTDEFSEMAKKADTERKEKAERDTKAEADRLTAQKAEEERNAKEKADRLAAQKTEAERLAQQKVDEERLAQAKAEAERKAKEDRAAKAEIERIERERAEQERLALAKAEREAKAEAERLAAQKADDERLAKQKADEELAAKAKAERLAQQKAEEERLAKAKAESDRKAKDEADQLAAQKAETERLGQRRDEEEQRAQVKEVTEASTESTLAVAQTKPASKGALIGIFSIVAVVVLIVAGLGIKAFFGGGTAATETPVAIEPPASSSPATVAPVQPAASAEKVEIRWFVGIGVGAQQQQVAVEQAIVDEFNNSQNRITVTLESVEDSQKAHDTLANEFAAGNGPDIVGPAGWYSTNNFPGQWLDLTRYVNNTQFDTSRFQPELVDYHQTDEGLVSLPFSVFPSALYYVPRMFDEAGLSYPPSTYGEKYMLDGRSVDWDWDTLAEVARRLTVDANGKNATESGFDRDQITQIGFGFQWENGLTYMASSKAGAADIVEGSRSTLPDAWKDAAGWYQNAIWGSQPFIATDNLANSAAFGSGNVFNGGKEAMTIVPSWYLCCMTDLAQNGGFQIAVLPLGDDGQVHSHMDVDAFRIWKGSQHPGEAFEFWSYLMTTGMDRLLSAYGAMSPIPENNDSFVAQQSATYPSVSPESWNVLVKDLAYPDKPSAEQYQPNFVEAMARINQFSGSLRNNPPSEFDLDAEWRNLVDDLNAIYQK